MSKLRIAAGSSSKNSVSFFLDESDEGIEAIRQKDGTIITKKINSKIFEKKILILLIVIFICFLLKEFVFIFDLPHWLYHIPTFIYTGLFLIGVLQLFSKSEIRMYHGAEHKVANWYSKGTIENNIENNIVDINQYSRIHSCCGTNLITTIVTFQITSSICLNTFNFHIPEFIIVILPFFVYKIFPFNILGMFVQFFTTATPNIEHLTVAAHALSELIEEKK